ncbi:nucleotidyl transferase [Desulfitobacterium hafniense]|uniref:Nucleotidyl transferase n=1 Tax=Desulfitobacterium hafniense TaxID=49338 RepID=A0A0W1JQ12_DESHA|nr:nucleotidyltransferase family protein [Desulfitobacterium hafniense]KTE93865.1 nucleotidyl transferase [Desulfitobacterium hafniense]
MKAILLAAGLGTRLRPLTDAVPKCLVPVKGKPLLQWWLELLNKHGITDVLINTHYLSGRVDEFVENYNGDVRISLANEKILLGSAGTIRANAEFFINESSYLIIYADNLTNIDLKKMIDWHRDSGSSFTMGVFNTNRPLECGIVELDEQGRIITFEEKPAIPKSNLANAGIYIAGPEFLDFVLSTSDFDIGKDVLPKMVGQMHGYLIEEYLIDIGTIDNYYKANKEWVG